MKLEINVPVSGLDLANLLEGERELASAIHDLSLVLLPPVHQ